MREKMYVLGMAVLLTALLALSGVAQSAMWVGGEIGGNLNSATLDADVGVGHHNFSLHPSVIGGATIGYDFVNAGFGAYAWPDWMKYFSFAMDLTYNKLDARHSDSQLGSILSPNSRLNGYEVAWTFLFMAHYGFLPDSEVPAGRVHPYLGVGPAIVWTGVDGTFSTTFRGAQRLFTSNFGAQAMNVALVVEPGVRFMAFKNVSIDVAMRYRYSAPSYDFNNVTLKINPLHQFAPLLRASYHF
jgi:opacity protein-like surface antigen